MLLWQYKHICFFQNWRYCVRWLSDNTGVCYCGNINTFVSFRIGDIVLGGSLTILVYVTVAILTHLFLSELEILCKVAL